MTGLFPHNHGVLEVLYPRQTHMHTLVPGKEHFAQRLSQEGYSTGYFGKWHVEWTNDLQRFGWRVDGGLASELHRSFVKEVLGDSPQQPELEKAVYITEPKGYGPHLFCGVTQRPAEIRQMGLSTTLALRYLEQAVQSEDPWCCFLSFQEPHDPYITESSVYERYAALDIPAPRNADDLLEDRPALYRRAQGIWRQLSEDEKREARTCYYASITEIDAQFARVVDFLEGVGELDNTIVIMMSDHGDLLGAHGLFFKDISAFEEIFNVPFIVRGPGVVQGAVCDGRVGLHDLCPTVLELAGCKPFVESDARSFVELLRAPEQAGNKWNSFYAEYYGNRHRLTQKVVWDGPWKFVFNGFDFDELYNLDADPLEMKNLAPDPAYRDQLVKMTKLFWQYARDSEDSPLVQTLYPALRLGVVGPLEEAW